MVISLQARFVLLISWLLVLRMCTVALVHRTTASDCYDAILHGPYINGEESNASYEVIWGNESSPVEITCQVDILANTSRVPAIALVIPELNDFEEIQHPLPNDNLYQEIAYTEPNISDNPMRYTYQISPKITMNGTVIRCGVGFSRGFNGSCYGEQVLIVHYLNSSILPQPTPIPMPCPTPVPCPTPSAIIVTKITTHTTTVIITPSIATPTTPMPNVGETGAGIFSTEERNGVIAAGAVSTVVIILSVAVALLLVVWKRNGSHCPSGKVAPTKSKVI